MFKLLLSGGKLVYLYTKKFGSIPVCGDCKVKLHGVSMRLLNFIYIFLQCLIFWCEISRNCRSKSS